MSTYFLIAFFILFGVMNLAETKIPSWVLGVTALLTALALIVNVIPRKPTV